LDVEGNGADVLLGVAGQVFQDAVEPGGIQGDFRVEASHQIKFPCATGRISVSSVVFAMCPRHKIRHAPSTAQLPPLRCHNSANDSSRKSPSRASGCSRLLVQRHTLPFGVITVWSAL